MKEEGRAHPDEQVASSRRAQFLFIHQNFPGQFVHLAGALARAGHEVVALGIEGRAVPGVRYLRYNVKPPPTSTSVPLLRDVEVKVVRGSACAVAMTKLDAAGFQPDVVIAHPGWGEALFCKDVWPEAKLLIFAEFFYNASGSDYNFDPEFSKDSAPSRSALRMKNTTLLAALHACDAAYTPTAWQLSQLPMEFQYKTRVLFDGIDTDVVRPNPDASMTLPSIGLRLSAGDEVITFVNRNLEPYRGFHTFMRALPDILTARPAAQCVIVGRDDVSYGSKPVGGGTWREVMLKELGDRLPVERVHFLGGLPYAEYLKVLQISRCHVYLTYPFVLGWSCLEAMSAGCTLIASDTGPVREVVEDGKTGLLVDFFDAKALARQVIDVVSGTFDCRDLGHAARASVADRYDLKSRCLPSLLGFVEELSGRI